jgi:hypothetical protein
LHFNFACHPAWMRIAWRHHRIAAPIGLRHSPNRL